MNNLNINDIMKRQERKDDEFIVVFNEDYKHNKLVQDTAFKNDFEIINTEYELLEDAFIYIQESLENGDEIDEVKVFEFVDSIIPIYTNDLLVWFREVGTEYTDQAIDEYGQFDDTTKLLMAGYGFHAEKVFFIAISILEEIIEKIEGN
jgi:hypothetical protein